LTGPRGSGHNLFVDGTADETPDALDRPELFLNRELSWLEFNQRVLDEARDPSVPLLERLKFLTIVRSNLEEFFMVRVAGLLEQRAEGVTETPPDGMTPSEQLDAIADRVGEMIDEISETFLGQILPLLEDEGVLLRRPSDLDDEKRARLRQYFQEQVFPILTPLALDPGHPFPHVPNKRLHLIVMLSGEEDGDPAFAVVQVPAVLPRLIAVPNVLPDEHSTGAIGEGPGDESHRAYVLLDDVIADNVEELFRGFTRRGAWTFRVIRNHDLSIDEEEAEDLLEEIREEVRRRDRGNSVVFQVEAPLALPDLGELAKPLRGRRDLQDVSFTPAASPAFDLELDPFDVIRANDVLLHHPYESFDPVVALLERAASDPDVLAIKQTLYRTSGDSPIVKALVRAAENGKQVAALVEIKARFDEENNIHWARRLEESGVHVVYGLVGLKTHCKVMLIVRREGPQLRRYVHLGTGNYNPKTATLYTDLSLFTARADFGHDATALFNLLTSCTAPREWRRFIAAPLGLHESVLGMIEREAAYARAGKPARIIAKMNSLQDADVIRALYRASQAGVQIDLIVRGICCLRPQIPGISHNIRVRSIVDRFLEHTRIFYFEAGGRRLVFGASADWMPRNFHRRVEVMFPVDDEGLRKRIIDEILATSLADDVKARELRADGTFAPVVRAEDESTQLRSQQRLLELASAAAQKASERAHAERPFIVRPVRHRPTKRSPTHPTLPDPIENKEPS
jgi:polyphosphate kinase